MPEDEDAAIGGLHGARVIGLPGTSSLCQLWPPSLVPMDAGALTELIRLQPLSLATSDPGLGCWQP